MSRNTGHAAAKIQTLSAWDVAYAINMALAAAITYGLTAYLAPLLLHRPAESVGILWAVISTVFVFRDTRSRSVSAVTSRLIATSVSFALCLGYLVLFPANPMAMIALVAIGTLVLMMLDRRDDISLAAVTTAVVLIVAMSKPQEAWHQPILRLLDTIAGATVGITLKWTASFLYGRVMGEKPR
jgi:uncharacterized membrane protein YgaE (UPF0421/DUF939 family)